MTFDWDWHLAIILIFLFFNAGIVLTLTWSKDLLISIIIMAIFSFSMAAIYLLLEAPDVAMTEAAVGACVTTLILLAAITLAGRGTNAKRNFSFPGTIFVGITGILLVYSIFDMPPIGYANSPANNNVAVKYYAQTGQEIGIPSLVAAILASYRGFDTLGETIVIFTASIGTYLVLSRRKSKKPIKEKT